MASAAPAEGCAPSVAVAASVTLGADVVIHHPELVNLYGCTIGDGTKIGTFVEIQKGVLIGRRCKRCEPENMSRFRTIFALRSASR